MNRRTLLRSALAAGSTGVLGSFAGCTGGSSGASQTDTTTSEPMQSTETESGTGTDAEAGTGDGDAGGPTVSVASNGTYGDVLVGPDGLSLYRFESDTRGAEASTCSGDCASAWPPLTTDGTPTAGDGVTAELSTFERESGATQVAANGWPLYYFVQDEEPGDANGHEVEGFGAEWYLLRPDGTRVESGGGDEGGDGGEASESETTTSSGY